jgi:hypothetical protein
MSKVRRADLSRIHLAGILGAAAVLLSGCFATRGDHRRYDHAYYAPVEGQARDIFPDPVGSIDRTIPNRLGSLDVRPTQFSFETDRAARARSQLSPPAPRTQPAPPTSAPPATTPNVPPKSGAAPQEPAKPIRAPGRRITPGIIEANQPLPADPVVGLVPRLEPSVSLQQRVVPVQ